jgi:hypothetical protein
MLIQWHGCIFLFVSFLRSIDHQEAVDREVIIPLECSEDTVVSQLKVSDMLWSVLLYGLHIGSLTSVWNIWKSAGRCLALFTM